MLGLSTDNGQIPTHLISTTASLPGYEVIEILGPVEGCAEKSFTSMKVVGLGMVDGGGLDQLLFDAKMKLASAASEKGANAVIGFRYAFAARELEKSVVAYGTAVRCRKVS